MASRTLLEISSKEAALHLDVERRAWRANLGFRRLPSLPVSLARATKAATA
jgi:hypothetical protein